MLSENVPGRSPSFVMVTDPVAMSPGFIFSAVKMAEPSLLLLCERLPAVNVLFGLADVAVNVAPDAITAAAAIMTTTIGSIRSSRCLFFFVC